MADETKTGLSWVQEPEISEGKIVYKYRNSGETDATFVGEMIDLRPAEGSNTVQSFQLDALAAGAEQETHVPLPADLPDGVISINIQIQTASGGSSWDGELLHELTGQIIGGALHPAGEQAPAKGSLAVDALDVKLDGDELVIHYRITGDAHLDMVSIFVSLLDPQGGSGWMNSFIPEVDREDIFRAAIPFGDVMHDDQGWAIDASVVAGDSTAHVQVSVRVHLPVERVDGDVVAGSWSSMTEA